MLCACLILPAGQPEGLDIYTSHLAQGERFLSLRRLLSRNAGPVMDLDYLLDDIMADVIPLGKWQHGHTASAAWLRTARRRCTDVS